MNLGVSEGPREVRGSQSRRGLFEEITKASPQVANWIPATEQVPCSGTVRWKFKCENDCSWPLKAGSCLTKKSWRVSSTMA